jgi:PAS domain S-box-containing protein
MTDSQNVPAALFSRALPLLENNESICIRDVNALPEETHAAKTWLQQAGIQAIAAFPMMVSGVLSGIAGFEMRGAPRQWDAECVVLLRALAEMISFALERKNIEAEIKYSKGYAALLNRVIPSALFTIDNEKRITGWNKRAVEITGYAECEMLGRLCSVFAESPCKNHCGMFDPETPKPITSEACTIRKKNGDIGIILKNADVLIDGNGTIIGGIESFEDITERDRTEAALRTAEAKLQEQNAVLAQKNAALKEIVAQIEIETARIKQEVRANINTIVLPLLQKLALKGASSKYVGLLEHHLTSLTASFGRSLNPSSAIRHEKQFFLMGLKL